MTKYAGELTKKPLSLAPEVFSVIRKPFMHLISLFLAASLLLAGCAPQATAAPESSPTPEPSLPLEPTSIPIVITDGLGRIVTLETPAHSVVAMAPSITESLFAIGAGGQMIGRDEFSDYPPEATSLPSIGGFFSDYNYEAIIELQPDLVLAAEINTLEQIQILEDLGLSVYWLANPTSLEEMYEGLHTLARLTGRKIEAEALIESLKDRVAAVEGKIADTRKRPTVFYELDSTDPNAPYTAGPGTFIDTLITMAGGLNVAADQEGQYIQLSAEQLILKNPDIILLGDAAYGVTSESVATRPGWEILKAVKNQRVYPFDDNLASRPGPRLVDGLEAMAKLFHPELFQ